MFVGWIGRVAALFFRESAGDTLVLRLVLCGLLLLLTGGITLYDSWQTARTQHRVPYPLRPLPADASAWRWERDLGFSVQTPAGRRQVAAALAHRPDGWWVRVVVTFQSVTTTGYSGPYHNRAVARRMAHSLLGESLTGQGLPLN